MAINIRCTMKKPSQCKADVLPMPHFCQRSQEEKNTICEPIRNKNMNKNFQEKESINKQKPFMIDRFCHWCLLFKILEYRCPLLKCCSGLALPSRPTLPSLPKCQGDRLDALISFDEGRLWQTEKEEKDRKMEAGRRYDVQWNKTRQR